ncbi:acyl-CoA-binding protein [Lentinula detonsa]|uniref:Acyl-CoA-binding protein n=2 Tax=Lentinula TaxID=5352 RepID=A0A9W8TT79_9AGAR|nr:acyl-CoA-binding protein [Lentinula detonsa]KAJ3781949.1 acyl-CoA-binding protein [Lentinula aff. detonsa]KAJ3796811.1 acyl-CoA-binding protein [Lentinula aff. detonsa]KAJ3981209.1 acyl-CoA-binding protein [Lentinula detonsa]
MSQAQFEVAVDIVKNPRAGRPTMKPSQDQQLFFYKHFKQVTVGDVNTSRPGFTDFRGKAMWDAWSGVKGMSKEDARKAYVDQLKQLLESIGDTESIAEVDAAQ